MAPYKLHGRKGSGSLAIQIALEEAGAPYECVWVGREQTDTASMRALNPTGRVPTLTLPDGTTIMESAAMLVHIAAANARAALAPPPGTAAHARFLQWVIFLSANVYEAVLRIYYADRYSARGEADAAAIRERAIEQYLGFLEIIGRSLTPYVLGREYSLADPYLYMLADWYPGDKSGLWSRIPMLAAHAELVSARPAVRKAEADHAA